MNFDTMLQFAVLLLIASWALSIIQDMILKSKAVKKIIDENKKMKQELRSRGIDHE